MNRKSITQRYYSGNNWSSAFNCTVAFSEESWKLSENTTTTLHVIVLSFFIINIHSVLSSIQGYFKANKGQVLPISFTNHNDLELALICRFCLFCLQLNRNANIRWTQNCPKKNLYILAFASIYGGVHCWWFLIRSKLYSWLQHLFCKHHYKIDRKSTEVQYLFL